MPDAAPSTQLLSTEPSEALSAGSATVPARDDGNAFSQPSPALDADGLRRFKLGNLLFRKLWIAAPSEMTASDGLGPLYNARSCQSCHLKDGRGHPRSGPDDDSPSLVLHLAIPIALPAEQIADYIATLPDPVYGSQLQYLAAPGFVREGWIDLTYEEQAIHLSDGMTVSLRKPTYRVVNLGYGPLAANVTLSPRIAPQMIGLGMLAAIPERAILAHADEDDVDGDGISGRPNLVTSVKSGQVQLGRFGLKAGVADIRSQVATAFSTDLGLSTNVHPDPWGDCTKAEVACRAAPNGEQPGIGDGREVDGESLDLVSFYSANLAVPERRNVTDPQVLRGKAVFIETGCASCHVPSFVTATDAVQPDQANQLIWPYSDLLLHDMGDGLADGQPEGRATGSEWRTPPLWGIGLTQSVSGQESYLHDGRARSLLEAILWHGGEGQRARDKIMAMPAEDRDALIAFLQSL